MDVTIERDTDVGVAEDFAEAFNVKSQLYTARGKCMSQCMEVYIFQIAGCENCFEVILEAAWLDIFFFPNL